MEIQFKQRVDFSPYPKFSIDEHKVVVNNINGVKIDFGFRPVEYQRLGPEHSELLLSALNQFIRGFYSAHKYIPATLIQSIDEALFLTGYWGKVTSETKQPIYAWQLIILQDEFKIYID